MLSDLRSNPIAINRARNRSKLLIVENDTVLRQALSSWLAVEFATFDIRQVESAEAALELASQNAPDIVLMDVGLPKLNGLEATEQMMALCPNAKIIIVTIHEDDLYISQAARVGAIDFIPKRRLYMELIPILRELLDDDYQR